MCGIIGIITKLNGFGKPLGLVLYECLKNLEYRGYDSVGFAVVSENSMVLRKSKGKIDDVYTKLGFDSVDGYIGIGHTRWATHGKPSDVNAHPHTDCSGRIAVVHNGIIENFRELRLWLETRGHRFSSETDTEVIPHLIEEFKRWGMDSYTAFKKAISILRGTYAIVAIDLDTPDRLYFARNTSPLVIGFSEKAIFIASDIPAFLRYTNRVLVLRDGEVGYAKLDEVVVEEIVASTHLDSSAPITRAIDYRPRIRIVEWSAEAAAKGGYPHFMLKEIYEQPQALAQTIAGLGLEIEEAVEILKKADRVIFVAAGTSFHASFIGRLALIDLAELWSDTIIASEARWYFKKLSSKDVVVAVSQSGETIDTLLAVREAKRAGAKVIAISNVIDSAIPRESDLAIYTRAGPEIGVAATKTFTTQIAVLLYLALRVGLKRGCLEERRAIEILNQLRDVPSIARYVIETTDSVATKIAYRIYMKSSAYYLGRGLGLGIAMEGALKMKEVAYLHAEAYPAGESKHGPIALVENGFPVVFVSLGEIDRELIASNIEEMKARDAWTILIAPRGTDLRYADDIVEIPKLNPYTMTIPAIIPLQLLAYRTAVLRGNDPDKPRNLAKTVTVV